MTSAPRWLILTGELPPVCGGVGDYTALLASALAAAGECVTVCSPPGPTEFLPTSGVEVVSLPDHYGSAARAALDRLLDRAPCRVLVQYVPQAFGVHGANLPFCRWLYRRARRGDDVQVMFHEPYLELSLHPPRALLAILQRAMAATLIRASRRVYVATEAWLPYLHPYAPASMTVVTLPIPSSIPVVSRSRSLEMLRSELLSSGSSLVGHFGTYGDHVRPLVAEVLIAVLQRDTNVAAVCAGEGSHEFVRALVRTAPALAPRLHSTGRLPSEDVSLHLQACDVLVQPYPDGVTTRRTTIMAALANGRAVVTTDGRLTEPVWRRTKAAMLVPAGDCAALACAVGRLLDDRHARASLAAQASSIYTAEFAMERTIASLRDHARPRPIAGSALSRRTA